MLRFINDILRTNDPLAVLGAGKANVETTSISQNASFLSNNKVSDDQVILQALGAADGLYDEALSILAVVFNQSLQAEQCCLELRLVVCEIGNCAVWKLVQELFQSKALASLELFCCISVTVEVTSFNGACSCSYVLESKKIR